MFRTVMRANSMIGRGSGPFAIVNDFASRRLCRRVTSSAILFGLTIAMASCGGGTGVSSGSGGGTGSGSIPAPTASLTAAPTAIIAGQNITLAWASTNADQGTVDSELGIVGLNGSTVLTPAVTTTYTYTAKGPSGTATASATVTVNPVNSFDGLTQSDGALNEDVDPNGAVGTKQFMEYVNTSYQAYDKVTGKAVWSSAKQIETLWPSGSNCNPPTAHAAIQLDVVVIFDRLASRWVVGAKTSDANLGYYLCIAVSNTDDLSSSSLVWNSYSSSKLDPVLGTNGTHTYFPDWPKFSTWADATGQQSAYYASIDLQDIDNGNAEIGAVVCAFDRSNILNNPTNVKPEVCVNVSDPLNLSLWSNGLFVAHSLIPADLDGTTAAPAGRDEFMVSVEEPVNNGLTTTSNTLNLWDFHVDWTAITPTLIATHSPISVSDYIPGCYLTDPNNPAITNCVQEPPNAGQQLIDSVGDRLMPRFAYRNFGSYESFLISQTVQTGPGASGTNPSRFQAGIRWYELRDSVGDTPAVYQSGTINPDASLFRFLPSIAQDKNGNAAVGYSISNVFTNPGIDFSYWSLPQATAPTEVTIIDGTGEDVSSGNGVGKWGTYSSMTVDPIDDCTFWYVNEYFVLDNTWRTRIANFRIPGCQ
jgi:hypothetical protein